MNENTNKNVRLSYGVALSAMTVIYGALLIWQVLAIYLAGNDPIFTADRVAAALSRISPAFWLWLAMIVGGFIIWEAFPVTDKRMAYKDVSYQLYRLKKRMPRKFEGGLEADYAYYRRGEIAIKVIWAVSAALGLACAVYATIYLANSANFPLNDVSVDVFNMVKRLAPLAAGVFILAMEAALCEGYITKKILPSAKKLSAVKRTQENAYPNKFTAFVCVAKCKASSFFNNKYFILSVRLAIGCVGVAFIVLGALNGNAERVLIKAIAICLECIGIG